MGTAFHLLSRGFTPLTAQAPAPGGEGEAWARSFPSAPSAAQRSLLSDLGTSPSSPTSSEFNKSQQHLGQIPCKGPHRLWSFQQYQQTQDNIPMAHRTGSCPSALTLSRPFSLPSGKGGKVKYQVGRLNISSSPALAPGWQTAQHNPERWVKMSLGTNADLQEKPGHGHPAWRNGIHLPIG